MIIQNKKIMAGFSIVEMMIAIALGFLLISVSASIWVTNKKSYSLQEDLGRIQENARFSLHYLEYDIRMAGYFGCNSMPDYSTIVPIESDGNSITIRYFSSLSLDIDTITRNASDAVINLTDPTDQNITEGQVLGISNCLASETVTVAVGGITKDGDDDITSIKTTAAISGEGYEQAKLHLFQQHVYTLNNGSLQRDGNNLINGIEAWEFRFGEDADGVGTTNLEPDSYPKAASVTDWQKVRSVRIALLVSSINEYGVEKDARTYDLLNVGGQYNPTDDRRRRRVFRTTIRTRNL